MDMSQPLQTCRHSSLGVGTHNEVYSNKSPTYIGARTFEGHMALLATRKFQLHDPLLVPGRGSPHPRLNYFDPPRKPAKAACAWR